MAGGAVRRGAWLGAKVMVPLAGRLIFGLPPWQSAQPSMIALFSCIVGASDLLWQVMQPVLLASASAAVWKRQAPKSAQQTWAPQRWAPRAAGPQG